MPQVKQTLSPEAMNCLSSIFHKPKPVHGLKDSLIYELERARLAKVRSYQVNGEAVFFLDITPAGKTRVMKWSVNA